MNAQPTITSCASLHGLLTSAYSSATSSSSASKSSCLAVRIPPRGKRQEESGTDGDSSLHEGALGVTGSLSWNSNQPLKVTRGRGEEMTVEPRAESIHAFTIVDGGVGLHGGGSASKQRRFLGTWFFSANCRYPSRVVEMSNGKVNYRPRPRRRISRF